jgi:hypothetical protein
MKKILSVILSLIIIASCTGCNKQVFDTTYSFKEAQIAMPDGSIVKGKITSWLDYEGDQIQIKIDGKTYLTHIENVVMIAE